MDFIYKAVAAISPLNRVSAKLYPHSSSLAVLFVQYESEKRKDKECRSNQIDFYNMYLNESHLGS
jgi:hypothetical protein